MNLFSWDKFFVWVVVAVITIAILRFVNWLFDPYSNYPADLRIKKNCKRCGMPYTSIDKLKMFNKYFSSVNSLCCGCSYEFNKAFKAKRIAIRKKLAIKLKCPECKGTRRIKGYRWEACNGEGVIKSVLDYQATEKARLSLENSPEWRDFF